MKKRYLFPLLLTLLMLVPCAIASAASYYYVNGTSWLRMRQLPYDNAKILASYRQDYAITKYTKYNNTWAYVVFSDGHEGYVLSKYVKSSSTKYAWINTDKTNLRSGPAKTFSSKAVIPLGEKVKVLTTGKNWSYVYSTNYGYGYISKGYLSNKKVSSETVYASFTAYVVNPKNRAVNFRSGPGKTYSVIMEVNPGTQLTVLSYGSNWCEVQIGNTVGYIMSEYLSRSSEVVTIGPVPAPDIEPDPTDPPFQNYTAYITSDNGRKVNLRKGPGTGHDVITQLPVGTSVTVVQYYNKNWSRIYVNGTYGYVKNEYLTTSAPAGGTGTTGTDSISSYTGWIKDVDGKKVNVRNGRGYGYGVIMQLEAGSKIQVLEDSPNTNWTHIKFGSVVGYVQSQYVTDSDPGTISGQTPDDPQPEVVNRFPFTAYVISTNGKPVNVRKGAGTGYAVNGSVPFGAKITIDSVSGRWYHMTYNGMKGYILEDFVSTTAPATITQTSTGITPSINTSSSTTNTTTTVIGTAQVVTPDGKAVNLRRGPSLNYANRTKVNNGETVNVLGHTGRWTYVEYNGTKGYIMSEFLK